MVDYYYLKANILAGCMLRTLGESMPMTPFMRTYVILLYVFDIHVHYTCSVLQPETDIQMPLLISNNGHGTQARSTSCWLYS
jgi:hypothetical protein